MWRADRVRAVTLTGFQFRPLADFDIGTMLGRQWLEQAMRSWEKSGEGTRIRMSPEAAARLRRDWYYRHATFTADGDMIVMAIPDDYPGTILPLCRWLGPDAEILAPAHLRDALRLEIESMASRLAGSTATAPVAREAEG